MIAEAPGGVWYYYDAYPGSWEAGLFVTYQGSLFNLTPLEILNITGLPIGIYTFYFGVDINMNGIIDNPLYYDSVEVNINQ